MPAPQIKFRLRKDGYALLTLDHLERAAGEDGNGNVRQNAQGPRVPPLRTPLVDQTDEQKAATTGLNRTWYIFFQNLSKAVQPAAGGGSGLTAIKFLCPSIDEEDILARGKGSLDGKTNPATFTPNLKRYYSRYGLRINVGDWIIWGDNGEIDRVVKMKDDVWTLQRGEFNSRISAQGKYFYRLEPKIFTVDLPDGELPPGKMVQFPWANKCVAAVRSWGIDSAGVRGPEYTLNLNQTHIPGWRTMNGAEYLIGIPGTLAVGEGAAYRVPLAAWESIRCIFASVLTPSTGSIEIEVDYILPRGGAAVDAVIPITTLTIPAGDYYSWPAGSPPDGRQMPYDLDLKYPPNLFPHGESVDPETGEREQLYVVFAPDGEIDLTVISAGAEGSEGADLLVTVQT
jgi:hypothetical protein